MQYRIIVGSESTEIFKTIQNPLGNARLDSFEKFN